jgi:hypothetical protein
VASSLDSACTGGFSASCRPRATASAFFFFSFFFPCISGFPLYFGFVLFQLPSARVLGVYGGFGFGCLMGASTVFGIWVSSVFEVGMPSGLIWVFNEGFYCIWVSCGSWVLLGVWVLFCGLAGLFLYILSVYLGAPYAF